MKYSSLSYSMLKLLSLLTHGFNKNNKAQENIFKHRYDVGAQEEWTNERISVSSYLDVDISNDK